MISWWNTGGGGVFYGRPCSGNCLMVMRSSVLVITLVLICIFFTLDEESQTEISSLESTLTLVQDTFKDSKSVGQMSLTSSLFCYNTDQRFRQGLRGDHWVLYNYIKAEKQFQCNESITYTTHGGYEFLDNLEPLLQRWQGPLSIAVYAPGTDFQKAIDSILYYRECAESTLVKDFVTFHVFFDFDHTPEQIPHWQSLLGKQPNCNEPEGNGETKASSPTETESYKKQNGLDYPVNVARNVARQTVSTHFVFPSDIELYPSPNLISAFLDMIRRDGPLLQGTNPRVFVNHIFEIEANHSLPETKAELVKLIEEKIVIPFHKLVASKAHTIPHAKEWLEAKPSDGMDILYTGKREKPYNRWEPIYIGTNEEPTYDERLTWEGRSDKMVQSYKMCSLEYDYHILDNAFLIHRPGIKTMKKLKPILQNAKIGAQGSFISRKIIPQVKKLYGARDECG